MVRKCRAAAEIAVMEVAQVGVRTRARALAAAAATATATSTATASSGVAKKRKMNTGELRLGSTSFAQLRSRQRVVVKKENSASKERESNSRSRTVTEQDPCSSPSSDHALTSCCSSNGSSEKDEKRMEFLDLEDERAQVETSTYRCCGERREMALSSRLHCQSKDLESTTKQTEADSGLGSPAQKMPTESELEEFFAAAEKDIQKSFAEKYNYDISKDKPLKGRYEWVCLKP